MPTPISPAVKVPSWVAPAQSRSRVIARRLLTLAAFASLEFVQISAAQPQNTPRMEVVFNQGPSPSPAKKQNHPKDDCENPGRKSIADTDKGNFLLMELKPDEALAACTEALQTTCKSDIVQAKSDIQKAKSCANGAVIEKQSLLDVSQKFATIDAYLANYRYDEARSLRDTLKDTYCSQTCTNSCIYQPFLRTYIETEIAKRLGLNEQPWTRRVRVYLGSISGIAPPPTLTKWLRLSRWLLLVIVVVFLIFKIWRRTHQLGVDKSWIVWSVVDEGKSGASGALMDALDWNANPLLRNHQCGERPIFWLAPPFLPEGFDRARKTNAIWSSLTGEPPPTETTIWNISEDLVGAKVIVDNFLLDPAYEELDVNIAGFTVKGLNGIIKFFKQRLYRNLPSIVGIVTRREVDGSPAWGVRLNANWRPGNVGKKTVTVSVFAESLPQEYGDPLAQVAQRAALKLMLRIKGGNDQAGADANLVTARAAYRQGIEMLRQLI